MTHNEVGYTLLYHGTHGRYAARIYRENINLSCSKPYLDFGPGFYTAVDFSLAAETAMVRVGKYNMHVDTPDIPCALTFEADESAFNTLRCLSFTEHSEEWCRFVLANRIPDESLILGCSHNRGAEYDIVSGPVADTELADAVRAISEGRLRLSEIKFAVIKSKPHWGRQISFHSVRAASCLRCINCDIIR